MKTVSPGRLLDIVWILLMLVTVMNATIAETVSPSLAITAFVAVSVAFKGVMVIEHFMGMKSAHTGLRLLMNAYFIVIPLLIILVAMYPELIASITRLS